MPPEPTAEKPPLLPPQLWLLIGGNGSGKSTFHAQFLARHGLPLVNADQIARTFWPDQAENHSYEAALLAEKERLRLVQEQQSFCFETVFSHPSKLDFIAHARAMGYTIVVFYFHLQDPGLNLARVAQRVAQGGHGVAEEKVRQRLPRTFELAQRLPGLVDELHLVDNKSAENPFQRLALWRQAQWQRFYEPMPDWAQDFMAHPGQP
ncbi:MAG: dephospho-CoA kinase [Halomonadaceae bacterium]|nr:MAG: dephospho-CoA kinase [Halomonadaceae bacterium]